MGARREVNGNIVVRERSSHLICLSQSISEGDKWIFLRAISLLVSHSILNKCSAVTDIENRSDAI